MMALAKSLDANAWDGEWYRRAYFDDGTSLGSALNTGMQDRHNCAELGCSVRRSRARTRR